MNHVDNRNSVMLAKLREELVGPGPSGRDLDCSKDVTFETAEESYGPFKQIVTGEEILDRGRPTKRYGVGVLFPTPDPKVIVPVKDDLEDNANDESNDDDDDTIDQFVDPKVIRDIQKIDKELGKGRDEGDSDDFDLSTANTLRPSSMGISFLVELPKDSKVIVRAKAGRYSKFKVNVKDKKPKFWWKRSPVLLEFEFNANEILNVKSKIRVKKVDGNHSNATDLQIECELLSRSVAGESDHTRLITACLINRKTVVGFSLDESCLFQLFFEVLVQHEKANISCIKPYPKVVTSNLSEEEESLRLLYRNVETFGVGHGCAADWVLAGNNSAEMVIGTPFPTYEVPKITADVDVAVPIAPLAGLVAGDDGSNSIKELIEKYKSWIDDEEKKISSLADQYKAAAVDHIKKCRDVWKRVEAGKKYLDDTPLAKKAFQMANHAILLQQIRSDTKLRKLTVDEESASLIYSEPHKRNIDPVSYKGRRGKWRAFQIAFLLMSVESAAKGDDEHRKTVELIWFPTGGGKTEAYLGLSAFSMFYRKLCKSDDSGVQVLMRYTLRLLTAQQFQRAAGLICAMEQIRLGKPELGTDPFSIGLWLGGDVTPNKKAEARQSLKKMNEKSYASNPFILDRCPWCKGQIGVIESKVGKRKAHNIIGYEASNGTVVFKCVDNDCEFSSGNLPIYVIDEDIYEIRPTMVIGTVDKFATLAWKPAARRIFGIDPEGARMSSPPSLIIQDELHLISGPLGSMVGLYETLVEELCTDRRGGKVILPKIVSSTATIRQYEQQIKSLYSREKVTLFPPPGIDEGNSFFAQYALDKDKKLLPGKIYVGVFAPSLGSMQTTQVRSFSALLQAPQNLIQDEAKDPWWSLMLFFNSLRELGTTLSLFQSDIPDYLKILCNRYGVPLKERRRIYNIMELTGRLRSDEVPVAISKLELSKDGEGYPVDVCLASNIIEVGIDIDRLSLISIIGQPKTTSQYIQVTGRVGRNPLKPGLVVTLYGVSKPRDRSHFEKFRSYHERLYAQVEPTSATPFSPPVLDRALHGLMAAYVRQIGDGRIANSPYPYPDKLIEQLKRILIPRIKAVDDKEEDNFIEVFEERKKEWRDWGRIVWRSQKAEDRPLLRFAGSYVTEDARDKSWSTPSSLRNVDAECEAHVTDLYTDTEGGVHV